jgi:hypothetical protein
MLVVALQDIFIRGYASNKRYLVNASSLLLQSVGLWNPNTLDWLGNFTPSSGQSYWLNIYFWLRGHIFQLEVLFRKPSIVLTSSKYYSAKLFKQSRQYLYPVLLCCVLRFIFSFYPNELYFYACYATPIFFQTGYFKLNLLCDTSIGMLCCSPKLGVKEVYDWMVCLARTDS